MAFETSNWGRRIRATVLILPCTASVLLFFSSGASAQGPCPSSPTVHVRQGALASGAPPLVVDLPESHPCHTVIVNLRITAPTSAGVAWAVFWRNANGGNVQSDNGGCYSTCDLLLPDGFPGVPSTLGSNLLTKTVELKNSYSVGPATYTLTVTMMPKPGYNRGGKTFAEAPLISIPALVLASLHNLESEGGQSGSSQYFKIQLAPGGTLRVSGHAHRWFGIAASLYVNLYNANQQHVAALVNVTASQPDPDAFSSTIYTHTGPSPAYFYIRIRSSMWLMS